MKRFFITGLLLVAFASAAICQDLLIRYDFVNRNMFYYKVKKSKDGTQKLKAIKNPRVGANKSIKIEYININPFIWEQPKMDLIKVETDSISSFNPFTMLIPSSISDKMGPLSLGLTRDAKPLDKQQELCYAAWDSLNKAYDAIDGLKYNYKLTKQEILDQSQTKIHNVLKTCAASGQIDTAKNSLKKTDFELLKSYFRDFCGTEMPNSTRGADDSKINAYLAKTGVSSVTQEIMPREKINKIETDYYNLSNADFTFENSFIVSDKDVKLHMEFGLTDEFKKKAAKDSATKVKSIKHPQAVKDESIFIPVAGGVRVSSSAGIGCTFLGKERKSYFINPNYDTDSVPRLDSKIDYRVVPVVGSCLNVYSRNLGAVNIGGTFGLAVALQETFSINYLFGATTVFGRKERILFTVGAVLSPVSVPEDGYEVGDKIEGGYFPSKTIYKPGIFFFVHYNIGKF